MDIYFVLHIVFLCIFVAQMFKQHDYTVIHHHIEVTYINETIAEGSIENVKPNRTYRAFDVKFRLKRELSGDKYKVRTHVFYFLNNEYKSSPIQFDVKMCDAIERNLFNAEDLVMKLGNISAKCPHKPRSYFLHNFNIPDDVLPPHIPEGDFMVQVIVLIDKIKICEIRWYGGIRYKVKRRERV